MYSLILSYSLAESVSLAYVAHSCYMSPEQLSLLFHYPNVPCMQVIPISTRTVNIKLARINVHGYKNSYEVYMKYTSDNLFRYIIGIVNQPLLCTFRRLIKSICLWKMRKLRRSARGTKSLSVPQYNVQWLAYFLLLTISVTLTQALTSVHIPISVRAATIPQFSELVVHFFSAQFTVIKCVTKKEGTDVACQSLTIIILCHNS
jgi:hypothetical protein